MSWNSFYLRMFFSCCISTWVGCLFNNFTNGRQLACLDISNNAVRTFSTSLSVHLGEYDCEGTGSGFFGLNGVCVCVLKYCQVVLTEAVPTYTSLIVGGENQFPYSLANPCSYLSSPHFFPFCCPDLPFPGYL